MEAEIVERIGSAYGLRPEHVIWLSHTMLRIELPDGSEYILGLLETNNETIH